MQTLSYRSISEPYESSSPKNKKKKKQRKDSREENFDYNPAVIDVMEQYQKDELTTDDLGTFGIMSYLAAQHVLAHIVKKSTKIIVDHFYDEQMPALAYFNLKQQIDQTLKIELIEPDMNQSQGGILDELEPQPIQHEQWSSYKVNVEQRIANPLPAISDDKSIASSKNLKSLSIPYIRKNTYNSSQISVKSDHQASRAIETSFNEEEQNYQVNFVDMEPEKSEDVEDVYENGLRLAYERDLVLKDAKERAERQRQEDIKENQRQMRLIHSNLTGSKAYTYDFDGRVVVQKGPKMESLPKTSQLVNFGVQNIETRNFQESEKPKNIHRAKKVDNKKPNESVEQLKQNQQTQSVNETIILNKGVSIIEDDQKRSGPQDILNQLNFKTQAEVNETLSNPALRLHLTKIDYEKVINTQNPLLTKSISQNSRFLRDSQNSSLANLSQDINSKTMLHLHGIVNNNYSSLKRITHPSTQVLQDYMVPSE